jgi:hypothetical protein
MPRDVGMAAKTGAASGLNLCQRHARIKTPGGITAGGLNQFNSFSALGLI